MYNNKKTNDFKNKYRNLDVLLLVDKFGQRVDKTVNVAQCLGDLALFVESWKGKKNIRQFGATSQSTRRICS